MAWLSTHKWYLSWLPLMPCSLLTRADRWPSETRASMPIPLLVSLCLLTLPGGRFQIETRVHHKCINMSKWDCLKLCFITLELAAVIRNEWWVWVLGLRMARFSLTYIIFGLHHSLLCFNFFAGTGLIDPHPTTHLKIGLPHAFHERFY